MAKAGGAGERRDAAEGLRAAALDLGLRAYDQHKNHARFQEQQRSWIMIAYLALSGAMVTGVVNSSNMQGEFLEYKEKVIIIILLVHAVLSVLVGFAFSKLSREFRRFFIRADGIIDIIGGKLDESDDVLRNILDKAKFGSAGDHSVGVRRFFAKRFGVAAIHNYVVSMFIGLDSGLVATIAGSPIRLSVGIFVVSLAASIGLFAVYNEGISPGGEA